MVAIPDSARVQALVERLERVSSPSVADAQRGMRVMHPRIHSIVPGRVAAGPAFTVRALPGSFLSVLKGLNEAPTGSILVVDAGADLNAGALWGDLVAAEARMRGLRGIVVDGAVRDRPGLLGVGLPTFAAGVTPRLGTNPQVGLTDVAISCGGAPVLPGDWIFADDDGVVSIAGDVVETILEAAETIDRREVEVIDRIEAGESLAQILGFDQLINAEPLNISITSRPKKD